jgi:hypothetical protein
VHLARQSQFLDFLELTLRAIGRNSPPLVDFGQPRA